MEKKAQNLSFAHKLQMHLLITFRFQNISLSLEDAWLLRIEARSVQWVELIQMPSPASFSPFLSFASGAVARGYLVVYGGIRFPSSAFDLGDLFPAANTDVFLWSISESENTVNVEQQTVFYASQQPNGLVAPSMVAYNDSIYVAGGLNVFASYCVADLWIMPILGWSRISAWFLFTQQSSPNPHMYMDLSTILGIGNFDNLLSFGGQGNDYNEFASFWHYYIKTNVWQEVVMFNTTMPLSRWGHSSIAFDSRLVIFGGMHSSRDGTTEALGELLLFDTNYHEHALLASWVMHNTTAMGGPAGRAFHVAATDGTVMIIHGGCDSQIELFFDPCPGILNDTWMWNPSSSQWTPLVAGPALYAHTATFIDNTVYIFGGISSATTLETTSQLWSFSPHGNSWKIIKAASLRSKTWDTGAIDLLPQPRGAASIVPLGSSGLGFILIGGASSSSNPLGDLWIYYAQEPSGWYAIQTTGLALKSWGFGAASVLNNGDLYVYGGANSSFIAQGEFLFLQVGCNAGDYSLNLGTQACVPCPQGSFSSEIGATSCAGHCPSPFTTIGLGSTSVSACISCVLDFCNGHGECSVHVSGGSPQATCTCSGWYRLDESGNCATPVLGIIVGCVLGVVVLSAIIFVAFRHISRLRGDYRNRFELSEQLLQQTSMTLAQLEKVWEIKPESLNLLESIGSGQFGDVSTRR